MEYILEGLIIIGKVIGVSLNVICFFCGYLFLSRKRVQKEKEELDDQGQYVIPYNIYGK